MLWYLAVVLRKQKLRTSEGGAHTWALLPLLPEHSSAYGARKSPEKHQSFRVYIKILVSYEYKDNFFIPYPLLA